MGGIIGSSIGKGEHILILPLPNRAHINNISPEEDSLGECSSEEIKSKENREGNVVSITIPRLAFEWDVYDFMATISGVTRHGHMVEADTPICTLVSGGNTFVEFKDLSPLDQYMLKRKYGDNSTMCLPQKVYSSKSLTIDIRLFGRVHVDKDTSTVLNYIVLEDTCTSFCDIERLLEQLYLLGLLPFDRVASYKQLKQVLLFQ